MNGDGVTVDRCDKMRAIDKLENDRRTSDVLDKYICEIKGDIKDLKTAVENGQVELMKRLDAKYDKLLYAVLGWIITTALLIYKS